MSARVAVFASGSGTNLQALLDGEAPDGPYRVDVLVTDRPCGAEDRMKGQERTVRRVEFSGRSPEATGAEIVDLLQEHEIDAVLLAGFLKLLPAPVCQAFRGRVLNIHPALLPSFGGKGMYGIRVHEAVIGSGTKLSGPTVHYVDERYDEGRILAQWPVPVLREDTPASLAERVLAVEHALYPEAARALGRSITGETGPPSFEWPGGKAPSDGSSVHESIRKAFGSTDG